MGQRASELLPNPVCCSNKSQKFDYQETPRGKCEATQLHVPKWFETPDGGKQEELSAGTCFVDNPQGAEGSLQQYSREWQGAYLMFSEMDHSSMYLKWSREPVEGALAFFQPTPEKVSPSSFKYDKGGQKEVLKSKVGTTGQGRTDYYRTWVQFIRECWKFQGVLTVLEAEEAPELKVKIVMLVDENHKVIDVGVNQPVSLEGIHAVVVAQSGTTIFNGMSTMAKNLFIETGHVYGAATALTPQRSVTPPRSSKETVSKEARRPPP